MPHSYVREVAALARR